MPEPMTLVSGPPEAPADDTNVSSLEGIELTRAMEPQPVPAHPVRPEKVPSESIQTASLAPNALLGGGSSDSGTRSHLPGYLKNPPPRYPAEARRLGQEGRVLLEVRVNEKGRAIQVAVLESSGHALLDEAALKAVRQWRFEPARVGGMPIVSRLEIPVRFLLSPSYNDTP